MAASNNIPPASTTDPEILNIALRALSLDISSATHAQGVVDHTGNKSANEALVSPQHFEAPTPRHTPTVSYDGGFSLPFGSMGRSNLPADGPQWDHDWSNSEALAAQRGQKMSTKDHHVSTSALDGAKAFDITPPATPRASGMASAANDAFTKPMSGANPASVAATANSDTIITPVRVRPAAGDALEIATRLQQQQQQQVQAQHASSAIFDSYRSPRAQQQLEEASRASLGGISNSIFTPKHPSTENNNLVSPLDVGGLGNLHLAAASKQEHAREGISPLASDPSLTPKTFTSALLGSTFVSPGPSVAANAAAVAANAAAAAAFNHTIGFAGRDTPCANPSPSSEIHAALDLSEQLDSFMSPGMGLDPTNMLFQNEQTANVYVNALPLTTTDDDLYRIGSAFGPVLSHKAIIAAETGLCKGYGFLLYTSREAAEHAIECLGRMGLQASFAKESFSARLRRMADKASANVYLSNLPTDMTTHQLEHLFAPHNVISMRILLNSDGTSRGVGFVRLRDRDIAHECIDRLHGKMLPGCASPLQVRFADSEGQKLLKRNAMMQNSINALNAQARDVLRSTGPGSDPGLGVGVGIGMGMGMEMGMPSPSASPLMPFPLPVTTASAIGGSPVDAAITSHYYLPYSPAPPVHAQAHSAGSGLLNAASTYGALQHQHQHQHQGGGMSVHAGLPTPDPSPGDAMAAMAAAQAHGHNHQMLSQTPGFAVSACPTTYNFSPSPLPAHMHAHAQLFGRVGGAGMTTTAGAGGPGRLGGLASPITPSLSLTRAPPSATTGGAGLPTTTTSATGRMLNPYGGMSSAATLGGGMNMNMNLAAFSPPMLNISLGAHQASMSAASAAGGSGGGMAGGAGFGYSGGVTAPYSSLQLQEMLGSSSSAGGSGSSSSSTATTKAVQAQSLPNGLVAASAEGADETHHRVASRDGKNIREGEVLYTMDHGDSATSKK